MSNHLNSIDQMLLKINENVKLTNLLADRLGINYLKIEPLPLPPHLQKQNPENPVQYPNYTQQKIDHSKLGG